MLWYLLPCVDCLIGCNGVAVCLLSRFLSCLMVVKSTGGILKIACRSFLKGSVGVPVEMSIHQKGYKLQNMSRSV